MRCGLAMGSQSTYNDTAVEVQVYVLFSLLALGRMSPRLPRSSIKVERCTLRICTVRLVCHFVGAHSPLFLDSLHHARDRYGQLLECVRHTRTFQRLGKLGVRGRGRDVVGVALGDDLGRRVQTGPTSSSSIAKVHSKLRTLPGNLPPITNKCQTNHKTSYNCALPSSRELPKQT